MSQQSQRSNRRLSYTLQISQHFGMPRRTKIFIPNPISLILLIIALIPIEAPVGPIEVKFLHIFDQINPVPISRVVAELSHQKWNAVRYATNE